MLWDASLDYRLPTGRYHVTFWAHNITNQVELLGAVVITPLFTVANPTQPRTFGATIAAEF
jgi:hypothetical protein